MCTVLEGIEGAECYIDDVLIWADTQEHHDVRLNQVLGRCESGIRLNASVSNILVIVSLQREYILTEVGCRLCCLWKLQRHEKNYYVSMVW